MEVGRDRFRAALALLVSGVMLASTLPPASAQVRPTAALEGKLVMVNQSDGHIYTANADGTQLKKLPIQGHNPTWSPDGRKIAYEHAPYNSYAEIFVAKANGTEAVNITETDGAEYWPDWSPDGTRILFGAARSEDGFPEVHSVRVDGTNYQRLTNTYLAENSCSDPQRPLQATGPAWSPDASQFVALGTGCPFYGPDLYVFDSSGTYQTFIDAITTKVRNTSWSPNGSKILYDDTDYIYVSNADGSGQTYLVQGRNAVWSPDGTKFMADHTFYYNDDGTNQQRVLTTGGPWLEIDWIVPTTPGSGKFTQTTFSFTDRIEAARSAVQAQVNSLETDRQAILNNPDRSTDRLNNAYSAHETALLVLDGLKNELAGFRASLTSRSQLDQADREVLDDYKTRIAEADRNERLSRLELEAAEVAHRDGLELIRIIDQKLFELGQQVRALDFGLEGVYVMANDVKVYQVTTDSPYPAIEKLDDAIKGLRAEFDDVEAERRAAFTNFVDAHRAATSKLEAVASIIWKGGLAKGALKTVKRGMELLEAASEGGWIGVAAKLVEQAVEVGVEYYTDDPVGDPNPGAADIEAWFKQGAVKTVAKTTVGRFSLEEGKDRGKDYLREKFEAYLQSVFCASNCTTPDISAFKEQVAGAKLVKRAASMKGRLRRIKSKIKGGVTDWLKGKAKDILLEDIPEQLFDTWEKVAWNEYITADIDARMKFALYEAYDRAYWRIRKQIEEAQENKAKLLAPWDPTQGLLTTVQKSWQVPDLPIEVWLMLSGGRSRLEALPLKVTVDGLETTPTATNPAKFTLDATTIPQADLQTLVIDLN